MPVENLLNLQDTVELAPIGDYDVATDDTLQLAEIIAGSDGPNRLVLRVTSFLAFRLDATEACCLVSDSPTNFRVVADARGGNRGKRLSINSLSSEVKAMVTRGLDWAHGVSAIRECQPIERDFDGPPPVITGWLRDGDSAATQGMIVALVARGQIVGILWIGPRRDEERYQDWDVALAQCAGACIGQAIGAKVRENEQKRLTEAKKPTPPPIPTNQVPNAQVDAITASLSIINGHANILRNLTDLSATQLKSVQIVEEQCRFLRGLISRK